MRYLGYRTVDMLVERLRDPRAFPVNRRATRQEMQRRLSASAPESGADFDALLARLERDVLAFASHVEHPGYFAFIPGSPTWPGALGDFIAAATNIFAGSWMEAAGPTQLELTVLDWFRGWVGYPAEATGILVSGGSAANMTALAVARESLLGAMSDRVVAYVSDQAHSSIARAARVLGFRPAQVRVIPVDDRFRLVPQALVGAMETDRRAGLQPLFVSASAGSTNTGAIDDLSGLAEVCREQGAWLHIDAAYGGFAAITDRGRRWLRGIEQADSITLDPHKWLFQPFECGALLVRDGRLLRRAFEITPDYLHDAAAATGEVNLADQGLQLTRVSHAFKVWLSIGFFGLARFRDAIDRAIDLAAHAQELIEASDRLELLSPRQLSIVCFRRTMEGVDDEEAVAASNADLVAQMEEQGAALLSSTRLRGRYALRMCIVNHTTTAEDVEGVLSWLERATPRAAHSRTAPVSTHYERHADVDEGWLGRDRPDPAGLRAIPLFDGLSQAQLERISASADVRHVQRDRTVVERWEASREFYVVLEGVVRVTRDGSELALIEPGGFFGELAALDWGAGYSYPRLATVETVTAARLLTVPALLLNELVRETPAFEERIRAAVRERLPSGPAGP